MTKRIITNKRDREKLKQQKKEEKQKRKEQRLQNSGNDSQDTMFAYVDEFGVLHSNPLDVKPKEEIDASTISISAPKQTEPDEPELYNGRVEHYNASKGYGFIKDLRGTEKYFFHFSNAPSDIKEGDKVTFETARGARGMNAVNISIIK